MRHKFYKKTVVLAVFIIISVGLSAFSIAEERIVASPVVVAVPVKHHDGLGKLLGKTMKMVSLKGVGILPKFSKARKSADRAAPEASENKLFDPRSKESPIRTARLFKIRFIPTVAVPVN